MNDPNEIAASGELSYSYAVSGTLHPVVEHYPGGLGSLPTATLDSIRAAIAANVATASPEQQIELETAEMATWITSDTTGRPVLVIDFHQGPVQVGSMRFELARFGLALEGDRLVVREVDE